VVAGATVHSVRRARTRPDPDRGEALAERPGAEDRVVSFDGAELTVNLVGPRQAPTLVMIHGFSADMTVWHFQWKELSRDFRCVLYDQRGHGGSGPAPEGDYSLEALGHDLKAILDHAAPAGPVALIGHSLGGMALLSFAGLYPEEFGDRVRAVVLANTSAGDLVKAVVGGLGAQAATRLTPWARRLAARPDRMFRMRQAAFGGRAGMAFLLARLTNFGPNAPASLVDHVVGIASRATPEVWTDLFASVLEMDLAHALEHITVPTLIVASDLDRLTPPSSAVAMKHRLPDARMVLFREAGHCAMLERHEQFNDVARQFLGEALPDVPQPAHRRRRTPRGRTPVP
jgi:pimeloyl-ACP methyl ester carboxylesterase